LQAAAHSRPHMPKALTPNRHIEGPANNESNAVHYAAPAAHCKSLDKKREANPKARLPFAGGRQD
jgi:hypothetical protein